jgi:FecR protein
MQSEETLAAYLDGSLRAEEWAALEEAALNEGELFREIVQQRQMEAALCGLLGESQRMEEAIMVSVRGVSDETAAARVMTAAVRGPTARPARTWMSPSSRSPALLAALVMIGCLIAAAWWWKGSRPPVLATVCEVHDARWSNGLALRPGAHLGAEQTTLDAGTVELQMQSGAIVALEGPATFALRDGNHLALASGKVAAFVPASAKGFTVSTPTSRVVDLGTRFGVLTDGLLSQAHVFEGSVDVAANSAPQTVRITAGSAMRIDGSLLQPIPVNEDAFPPTLRRVEGLQRDGSFEKTKFFPATTAPPGEWSAARSQIVNETARGVRPNHGRSMVQLLSGASAPSDSDESGPRQVISLKQWQAEIATGQVAVVVSARFNQAADEPRAMMGIGVAALRGEEVSNPISWNALPPERKALAGGECDADPRTWERRHVRLKLPPDTVAIVVQLQEGVARKETAPSALPGQFADNVAVTLLLPHHPSR